MIKMIRSNKITFYALIFVWFLAGSVIFNYTVANATTRNDQQDSYRYLRLFSEVLLKLRTTYVEELAIKDLIEYAVDGMLSDVDPHTTFFRPDDFKDFTSNTMGEFGGLGITIDRQGDYITVVSPIEGTPAYKMGLQAGDKIVTVDNENVVGMKTDEVIKRMRGEKGTRVLIGIERPGVKGILDFDIVRDIIKIKSVPYAFKLDNGVGYVRIRQFNANTTIELRQALDKLEAEGIRGLLIDLRFNPGGLLNEAVDTVNEFIGPNKLVVSTKGRMRDTNREYYTMYNRMRSGYPVVVLINEASASASEIFAGSLQDWDKGIVVGKTSFGKGSVQQLYPLSEGYGLKVTISKYYIKSGRCIHKDINDKLLRGKRVSEEEQKALDKENKEHIYFTVNGREVRGGGGIVPDIEIEQSRLTQLEMEIRRKNLLFEFSVDYFSRNKDKITEDFIADDKLINEFLSFGRDKGLTYEKAQLDSSYSFIQTSLTKDIIDKQFGEQVAYRAAIPLDKQLSDAINLFDKFETLEEMFNYAKTLRRNNE